MKSVASNVPILFPSTHAAETSEGDTDTIDKKFNN